MRSSTMGIRFSLELVSGFQLAAAIGMLVCGLVAAYLAVKGPAGTRKSAKKVKTLLQGEYDRGRTDATTTPTAVNAPTTDDAAEAAEVEESNPLGYWLQLLAHLLGIATGAFFFWFVSICLSAGSLAEEKDKPGANAPAVTTQRNYDQVHGSWNADDFVQWSAADGKLSAKAAPKGQFIVVVTDEHNKEGKALQTGVTPKDLLSLSAEPTNLYVYIAISPSVPSPQRQQFVATAAQLIKKR